MNFDYHILYNLYNILWHIDPLLGNSRETNNKTKAIARQQFRKYAAVLESLLDSNPQTTVEILFEAVSVSLLQGYIT
jgi:hypothetical protein